MVRASLVSRGLTQDKTNGVRPVHWCDHTPTVVCLGTTSKRESHPRGCCRWHGRAPPQSAAGEKCRGAKAQVEIREARRLALPIELICSSTRRRRWPVEKKCGQSILSCQHNAVEKAANEHRLILPEQCVIQSRGARVRRQLRRAEGVGWGTGAPYVYGN